MKKTVSIRPFLHSEGSLFSKSKKLLRFVGTIDVVPHFTLLRGDAPSCFLIL